MKLQCPLPVSIINSDGVADVNHVPVICNTGGACEILAWDQLLAVQVLDHLDGNDGLNSLSQESQYVGLFITPNMTTTEAISVVKSLDKYQIYLFLKHHFVPSETFPFPKEYIV